MMSEICAPVPVRGCIGAQLWGQRGWVGILFYFCSIVGRQVLGGFRFSLRLWGGVFHLYFETSLFYDGRRSMDDGWPRNARGEQFLRLCLLACRISAYYFCWQIPLVIGCALHAHREQISRPVYKYITNPDHMRITTRFNGIPLIRSSYF